MKKYLQLFKQALKGENYDYTTGSINKALFLLAIPMILEMILESTFAIVDIFFVAKIGPDAVAIVGTTEAILMLIESLAIGLAVAATSLIARRVGEKDIEKAKKAAVNAIFLGIVTSLSVGILVVIFAPNILSLMGCGPELIRTGTGYTRILLGLNVFLFLLFVNNAIFRGAGNASVAMRSLWLANGLNIVLDPILIFGIGEFGGFGLEGAAMASCIGRGSGVLYQFYRMFDGSSMINLKIADLKIKKSVVKKLIDLSAGGAGQFLIATASWIFLIYVINSFGEKAMAGYTIGIRVIIFCILPSWGLSNAVATLVGQNLGAQQPDRAETTVWKAGKLNMVFLFLLSIFIFFFASEIIKLFNDDTEVIKHGVNALRIISAGYIAYAYQMVIGQAFNGAGDTRTPTLLNFVFLWLVQIPLAFVLSFYTSLGVNGVYVTIAIASTLLALTSIYLFRKGKWKLTKV